MWDGMFVNNCVPSSTDLLRCGTSPRSIPFVRLVANLWWCLLGTDQSDVLCRPFSVSCYSSDLDKCRCERFVRISGNNTSATLPYLSWDLSEKRANLTTLKNQPDSDKYKKRYGFFNMANLIFGAIFYSQTIFDLNVRRSFTQTPRKNIVYSNLGDHFLRSRFENGILSWTILKTMLS